MGFSTVTGPWEARWSMEARTTIAGQLTEIHADCIVLGGGDSTGRRILLPPAFSMNGFRIGTHLRVMIIYQNGDLIAERIESPPPSDDLADLLAELSPETDLAAIVKRVSRRNLPWVVVSSAAVAAWRQRDPAAWTKVSEWLAAKRVAIIQI
jgi:hypothetical protein